MSPGMSLDAFQMTLENDTPFGKYRPQDMFMSPPRYSPASPMPSVNHSDGFLSPLRDGGMLTLDALGLDMLGHPESIGSHTTGREEQVIVRRSPRRVPRSESTQVCASFFI